MNEERDILKKLFAELPDEQLPLGFNDKLTLKIQEAALQKEKRAKLLELAGYILCGAVMVAAIVFVFYISGYSFELPDVKSYIRTFKTPDFEMLKSPSFIFSLYIGTLAFLLLVADSMLRRYFKK